MRPPPGEVEGLKGRRDAPVRIGEHLPVAGGRGAEGASPREVARPPPGRIGLAHGAQIVRERLGAPVGDRDSVAVDHRQREAGPLQQGAQRLNVGEGRDMRAGAAFLAGLCLQERLAELEQSVAAQHRREQQAVGLEGAPDLNQDARQIVHPMQAERADDEIERGCADRQPFLVGDEAERACGARHHARRKIGLDEHLHSAALAQHRPKLPAVAAEIEHAREPALHVVEPAYEALADLADQKVAVPAEARGGAVAMGAHGAAVEDRGAVGRRCALTHGAGYGMMGVRREARTGRQRGMWSGAGGGRAAALARAAAAGAIDLVLPPSCLSCYAPVGTAGALCPDCWKRVVFIGHPCCARCGSPFELEAVGDALCGACIRKPPVYDRARAAFVYEGAGRELILAFKMADRSWLAPRLAAWLYRAAAPLLPDADLVVPVPLHRWRLLARRFNQAAVLAGLLARRAGTAISSDLLVRTRRTRPQVRLSGPERRRNVRGAFAVRHARAPLVNGRSILLVDDVMTTGATASACARALRKAGAARVDVVTIARAVRKPS